MPFLLLPLINIIHTLSFSLLGGGGGGGGALDIRGQILAAVNDKFLCYLYIAAGQEANTTWGGGG